jgi:tRNA-dihydrouridine synthase
VLNYQAGPNLYTIIWKRKINEMKNLDRGFSIAPMMGWTDRAGKAKYNEHLSMAVVSRVVPNTDRAVDERAPANEISVN